MKKTALYDEHIRLGGKMVDFGGFLLPVQYSGITAEHGAVRTHAGIFDVSHMGEFFVSGEEAEAYLQKVATNDISKLQIGRAMYTLLCRDDGGILDDILVYRLGDQSFMLVPNAGNIDKDWQWLQQQLTAFPTVELVNESDKTALFAVQGPNAQAFLEQVVDTAVLEGIRFYRFQDELSIDGKVCLISRTGYTGEDGFEIYHNVEDSLAIWSKLMSLEVDGKTLVPAGLGARDSLRLEAGLPLYGNELSEETNPLEAGLNRFVKLDKEDFIGLEALKAINENGASRRLIGVQTVGRGIPRHGYEVYLNERKIGELTSGGPSPTLGIGIGFALISDLELEEGASLDVQIRNKPVEHKIVSTPFYKRPKK